MLEINLLLLVVLGEWGKSTLLKKVTKSGLVTPIEDGIVFLVGIILVNLCGNRNY
jgi:hypothetical protein